MQFIADYSQYIDYIYQRCHCCNAGQTKEERRLKYAIAKYCGKCVYDARIYRDWNRQPFAKKMGYSSWEKMIEIIGEENAKFE